MAVINTNYLALVSQNNLTKSQNALGTAIERLSSGLRINSAKDDAAGQAIANRFTANIKGLTQAARNANDGISIAQTTEGALNEINNNLQRIRELTVQAQNGTNSDSDLQSIQEEINQRLAEIDRVSQQTQFNGVRVLGKQATELNIQVGANDNETIKIGLREISSAVLGLANFNVAGQTPATAADLEAARFEDNKDGSYTRTVKHDTVTAATVFSRLQDGNTVTKAADGTVYTYNAGSKSFTYNETSTSADLATALQAAATASADGFVTAKLTTTDGVIEVKIADDGNLTTLNDEQLYITADGNISVTNLGGGTAADIANVLAAAEAGADLDTYLTEISVGGVDYAINATDEWEYTATISAAELLEDVNGSAAAGDYTADLGTGGGVVSFGVNGETVTSGADTLYLDEKGAFTAVKEVKTTYYVDAESGKVTDADGKQVFIGNDGSFTTETTGPNAGVKTANPLDTLDKALADVDKLRSELGAVQNRFESTITNLNNTIANLSAARSRIEDADYAVEVSNMTRAQILQQAGTSVLAQANQVPQTVLSLLR